MLDLKAKPYYLSDADIKWVNETLMNLTLEEKVGQLFCEIINSAEESDIDRLFKRIKPGAIMFRPITVKQTIDLVCDLQSRSDIPMLIAGNLERGGNGATTEGTYYGANLMVSSTGDPAYAYKQGLVSCREGASLGFNWSFEPILDIDYNAFSPLTGARTYSSDPETVRKMAKAYMKGAQESGIAVTLKHWPGDGMDFRDQHLCCTVNTCSVEEWDATYRKNYQELIDEGAESIMAAHIRLPAYSKKLNPALKDEEIMPGSLSYELTTTLLKEEMGFNGLVVSDATQMAGFTQFMPRNEAVPKAIAAGCDVFLFSINHEEDVQYMLDGVKNGIITEERLNDAVTRILGMKAHLKLHEKKANGTLLPTLERAKAIVGCDEHRQWAVECADASITLVKNKGHVIPISPEKQKRVLFRTVTNVMGRQNFYDPQTRLFRELLEKEGFEVTDFSDELVPCKNVSLNTVADMKKDFDLMIYVVNNVNAMSIRYHRILWQDVMQFDVPKFTGDIPVVMVSLGYPYAIIDAPMVHGYVNAYIPTDTVVRSVIEKLVGRSDFQGVNAIDPFAGLWDAKL